MLWQKNETLNGRDRTALWDILNWTKCTEITDANRHLRSIIEEGRQTVYITTEISEHWSSVLCPALQSPSMSLLTSNFVTFPHLSFFFYIDRAAKQCCGATEVPQRHCLITGSRFETVRLTALINTANCHRLQNYTIDSIESPDPRSSFSFLGWTPRLSSDLVIETLLYIIFCTTIALENNIYMVPYRLISWRDKGKLFCTILNRVHAAKALPG